MGGENNDFFFPFCMCKNGNFASPHLTRPSPLRPAWIFPTAQRLWGGDGVRFQPRTIGRDEDGFGLFRPTPLSPSLSSPCLALLRVIIINFSYPKTLLFKHTYQYQFILFYPIWFFAFILLCVMSFFFFCDYLVKHLDILFNFFLKIDLI